MKKLLLIAGVLISTAGMAQDKGYIGLNGGLSMPMGEFGASDMDGKSGYAMTGTAFDLHGAYMVSEKFGITAVLRFQSHKVDVDELASQNRELQTAAGEEVLSVNVAAENWKTNCYMIGGYTQLPLGDGEKLHFTGRILFGLMSAKYPEMTVSVLTDTGLDADLHAESTGSGFAFGLGAGLKYNLSERFFLGANLDYTSSQPKFDVEIVEPFTGTKMTVETKSQITTLNFGVGVGYNF